MLILGQFRTVPSGRASGELLREEGLRLTREADYLVRVHVGGLVCGGGWWGRCVWGGYLYELFVRAWVRVCRFVQPEDVPTQQLCAPGLVVDDIPTATLLPPAGGRR